VRSNGAFIDRNIVNITEQPTDASFTTGDEAILAVAVSVPSNTTMTYQWFFDDQEINGADTFIYRARQSGTYKAKITSQRNGTSAIIFTHTANVSEVPAPEIASVVFGSPSIAVGDSTTITATFSYGNAILTPGNISLTSGVPHTISPNSTTSYTVRVRNSLNNEVHETHELVVTTGQFTVTANNATGDRSYGSTAVKLLNGKVLIFGSGYNYNTTVDLFDPTTNTFTTTGSLRRARSNAPGVLLNNGRVLVAGGFNGTTSMAATELYDPNTGQFTDSGFMNLERRNHALVKLHDGRVMVFGGFTNNSANNYTSTTEIYDPVTGVWTIGPSMNSARSELVAVLLHDNRILIAGGYNSVQGHLKTAEIYNPYTNQITLLSAQMNIARSDASIIATPQGAVIIAGQQGSTIQSRFEIFNSSTDSFASIVPELDQAVSVPSIAVRSDGVVVIFGGVNGAIGFFTRGYLFDPSNNRLVDENVALPIYRSNSTATTLDDGRILFVGGNLNERTSAVIYSY
jgi:N-acetylneuraminic acid mutarotase